MHDKSSKSRKSSKPTMSPVAAAISSTFAVVYSALCDVAQQSADNKARGESRSTKCVAAIKSLREACPDEKSYTDAVVGLFGNGKKKKDERIIGSLAEKLDAEKVGDLTARVLLSQCRTVALSWSSAAVRKAAEESGIRAGYDAAKPKAEAEKKAEPKAEPKAITLPELIGQVIGTLGGDIIVLRMVESALVAAKKPIHAAAVHDAAVRIAALAQ